VLPLHDSFIFHPNFKTDLTTYAANSLADLYQKTSIYSIVQNFTNALKDHATIE
jgi:hypothetical protein